MRFRFRRCQRLKKTSDFLSLRQSGKRVDCGAFIVQVGETPPTASASKIGRLGVITSRKVGCAVVRNRARRVFREIYRLNQSALPSGLDVVIIVRPNFEKVGRERLVRRFKEAILGSRPTAPEVPRDVKC